MLLWKSLKNLIGNFLSLEMWEVYWYFYCVFKSKTTSVWSFAVIFMWVFMFVAGEVRDMPVALHIPILYPCMPSEELRITIDSQRGTYLASLPSHGIVSFKSSCTVFTISIGTPNQRRQYALNVKACFLDKIRNKYQNFICWNIYPACC